MYRAFYKPKDGSNREEFIDATDVADLPDGALLVVQVNDDGTREVYSEKKDRTPKEEVFYGFATRYLEPKHDGGLTAEMIEYQRENRR